MRNLREDYSILSFLEDKMWYFPTLNTKRKGKLIIKDSFVELHVKVKFKDLALFSRKHPRLIYSTTTGTRISLLYGYNITSMFSQSPKPNQFGIVVFHATHLNCQLFNNKPQKFVAQAIYVDVPHLNVWLGRNEADYDYVDRTFKNKEDSTLEYRIGNRTIEFTSRLDVSGEEHQLVAKSACSATIRYDTAATLFTSMADMKKLENFFNLIFRDLHAIDRYHTIVRYSTGNVLPIVQQTYPSDYSAQQRLNTKEYYLLFTLNDISNIEKLLQNWYEHYEKLEPIMNNIVYLKSINVTDVNRFMTLVNSLETLHRKFFNFRKYKKKEYKDIKFEILESVDTEYKELVKRLIEYGFEPTLQERMKDIYSRALALGALSMNDEHFEKLSNTRNYYTHFNDYLSTLILSNAELVTVNNRLASYLKVLLLSVLGATDEELRTITAERFVFKDFYKDQPAQIG